MKRIPEVAGVEELLTALRRLVGRRRRLRMFILLLGVGLVAPASSDAQVLTATLRGTVTDTSGANIPGAKITLSEPSTGRVVRQTTSSSTGEYEFDELQPSTYLLTCDATGFQSFQAKDVVLDPGQIRRVDPVLTIGQTSTTVTVSAGAAVINTESSTMSETFSQAQQEKAPLVSTFPDAYILLTLSPGVQGGNGDYPVINGQQQTQQAQGFDGIPDDLYGEQSNNSNFFEQSSATTFNAPAESAVPGGYRISNSPGHQYYSWHCELPDLRLRTQCLGVLSSAEDTLYPARMEPRRWCSDLEKPRLRLRTMVCAIDSPRYAVPHQRSYALLPCRRISRKPSLTRSPVCLFLTTPFLPVV